MKKLLSIILAVILIFGLSSTAYAAEAIAGVKEFKGAGGAENINKSDNYYLDVVSLGLFDTDIKMINAINNAIFGLEKWIARLTCVAFYHMTTVNIADIIQTQTGGVQKSLKDNLFDSLVPLAFAFVGLYIASLLLKKNMSEIYNQLVKFVLIIVCANMLVTNSAGMIRVVDSLTSAVSSTVMAAFTGQEDKGEYGVTTAGTLWRVLIHEPWLTLEFGSYDYTKDHPDAEKKLLDDDNKPESENRQGVVNDIAGITPTNKDNPKAFGKEMPIMRLPLILFYLVPLLAKCLIYLAIATIQLAFRVMTILLFYIGILILVLSLVPQLGGTRIIISWLNKVVEMQIMIILLSFTLGFITLIDNILHKNISSWGWLITIVIQTAVSVVLFLFRDKILDAFGKIQKVVQNPARAAIKMRDNTGNVFTSARNFNRNVTTATQDMPKTMADIKDRAGAATNWAIEHSGLSFKGHDAPTKRDYNPLPYIREGAQASASAASSTPAYNDAAKSGRPLTTDSPALLPKTPAALSAAAGTKTGASGGESGHTRTQESPNPILLSDLPGAAVPASGTSTEASLPPPDEKPRPLLEDVAKEKPTPSPAGEAKRDKPGKAASTARTHDWPERQYHGKSYTPHANVQELRAKAGAAAFASAPVVMTSNSTPPPITPTATTRPTLTAEDSTPKSTPKEPVKEKPKPSTSPEKRPKTKAKTNTSNNMADQNKGQREASSPPQTSNLKLGTGKPRTPTRKNEKNIKRPDTTKKAVDIDIVKEED